MSHAFTYLRTQTARSIHIIPLARPRPHRVKDCPGMSDEKHDIHTAPTVVNPPKLGGAPENAPPDDIENADPAAIAGIRIGNYTLIRIIGSGGMGTVFEARQESPRRVVALKIMKSALGSRTAQRRFEYEAQLLARLRHPGIAQIYEAGTHTDPPTSPGASPHPTPYYVMEYIPDARNLAEFCRARGLTVRERLELFARVCDAVHHGHTKGVIHRDLKPANILVDSAGEPKVIDFGVARSADREDQSATLRTEAGVLVGTVQYMSPEQVAADPEAVDTRSDVYALGVILYELLSGRLPYDVSQAPIHEAARLIREQPATRLSTWRAQADGPRSRDGSRIADVRGDVETIVMKALEKGPERRYQSAADLAADLRRYLNNEPIAARPPSMTYQLRVMVRKHKVVASALGIVTIALIAAVVVSTYFAIGENRERAAAIAARDQAKAERDRALRVTEFLKQMLATADPTNAQGKEPTVRELLDIASGSLPEAFKEDPIPAAGVRITLGQTYYRLGDLNKALAEFQSAYDTWLPTLGADDPDSLNALALIGAMQMLQGKTDIAEKNLRTALERQTKTVGPEHPDTLSTMTNLAMALQDQGRLDDSEKLQRESLALKQKVHGPVHDETIATLNSLADLLLSQGKVSEALKLSEETDRAAEKAFGPKHPSTLMAQALHASALHNASRYTEENALLTRVYDLRIEVLGKAHPDTITTLDALGLNEQSLKQFDKAEARFREAAERSRDVHGADHKHTLTYFGHLAHLLTEKSTTLENPARTAALDEAEALFVRVIEAFRRIDGPMAISTLSAVNNSAIFLENRGKFADAEPRYREVIAGFEVTLPPDHWLHSAARKNLADCLVDLQRYDDAEQLLKDAYAESSRILGADHQRTRGCATSLERLYTRTGKPEETAKWAPLAKQAETPKP